NVDFIFSEDGSYLTDDARNVTISQDGQMSFERSLYVEAIKIEKSGRASVQHDGARSMLALMGAHGERNHVTRTRILWFLLLLHLDAALGCDRDSVHQVHAVDALLERAFERGVTQQCSLPFGHFAVVANRDALHVS